VALLRHMAKSREAEAFIASLPIAGVDGTIEKRMRGTPAEGNVRAKTGGLRWSATLSGYVTAADGRKLVFSLMLNRHRGTTERPARAEIDEIAVLLAAHRDTP
jgi:D-alanyl-D-alanine carboxypeptidase/D-alanyl-D-alanine-endopeptidase (penicillin-binding protein 4)